MSTVCGVPLPSHLPKDGRVDDELRQDELRDLGARIAGRRRELGLSQAALADRLGLASAETVSRYERGEREPRYTTLLRLADILETIAADLLPPSHRPAELTDTVHGSGVLLRDIGRLGPEAARATLGALRGIRDEWQADRD